LGSLELADSLRSSILAWKPDHKLATKYDESTRDKWAHEIDRLVSIDKVTADRIRSVIAYLPSSQFWAPNIQSPQKLRKHFDRLEAESRQSKPKNTQLSTKNYLEGLEELQGSPENWKKL
jgi:hypothetical protein